MLTIDLHKKKIMRSSLKILLVQDHLQSGGAAKAAGRWEKLLLSKGMAVRQVAGDQGGAKVFQVSGKPRRGLPRIGEFLAGSADLRKRTVQKQFVCLIEEKNLRRPGFITSQVEGNGGGRKR